MGAAMDYEACVGCEELFSDGSSIPYVEDSFFYTFAEAQNWVEGQFERMRGNGFVRLWGNIYHCGLISKTF